MQIQFIRQLKKVLADVRFRQSLAYYWQTGLAWICTTITMNEVDLKSQSVSVQYDSMVLYPCFFVFNHIKKECKVQQFQEHSLFKLFPQTLSFIYILIVVCFQNGDTVHKLRFLVKMFFLIRTVPIMKRNVFWQVIFVYSLLDSLNSGLMIALQMQSIYSCIQVSEDFVSPEHIAQSFHLTHELRHQSKDEINYEDKFQV